MRHIGWRFYDSTTVHEFQQKHQKEVEICMLAQWIGEFVGQMHCHRVSITQIAQEMGVTREYLSAILNGHKNTAGMEVRLYAALDSIVKKRKANT